MKVKVDELQASLLSSPLPQPLRRPVQGGQVTIYKRDCLLVRARANQGQVGYGVGTPSPNVAQLINRNLRAAVVGLNPGNLAGLRRKVFQRRPRYPGVVQAFAAVEMALLDLQGQIAGCPLSELLGGRVRGRVRIYASGGVYLDGEESVREAGLWAGSGFSACKLELGRSPRQDLQAVRELRPHPAQRAPGRQLDRELLAEPDPRRAPADLQVAPLRLLQHHSAQQEVVPLPAVALQPQRVAPGPK